MARYAGSAWRNFRPAAGNRATGAAATARTAATARVVAPRCRILGLDPGSLRTGFGIIDCVPGGERQVAYGCIRTGGGDLPGRLRVIYDAVALLVAEHRPDEVAIERVFMARNPDSALKLGQARGAAICAASVAGAAVHEYAPRLIKRAVSGYGAADKRQVAQLVALLLELPRPPQSDAADALAVAICHSHSRALAGAAA
jgi:crossover junction endodeoxyribonuclease RuvC